MGERMRVKAGVTAEIAGVFYGPGWIMEMPPAAAAEAVVGGDWEPAPAEKAAKVAKPEGDLLTAAIVEAIGKLQPDDFGRDGKPHVKAIEAVLGYDIAAADRDAAWSAVQAKPAS